jgi:hypothetical protein
VNKFWAATLACALVALAHESGHKNLGPTKAAADLKLARNAMESAKRKLTADGRYSCCVRPSCSLCARVNGSCNCAANVQAGRGACGECLGGWKAGRGDVKGVKADSVTLLTADHQACPRPGAAPAELRVEADALLRAKRTMASEKRYTCCIRGGCGQCAHETSCPCGGDLATRKTGVCGECLDGWRSGRGAFDGIDPAEVALAEAVLDMAPMTMSQQPPAAPLSMISTLLGGWTVMASGQIFGVYSAQSGPRGRDKIYSPNWAMLMASRRAGPGTLTLRAMLSAEAATVTKKRYPLLFAGGETADGVPIINGQHPHDVFMELAASYKVQVGERTSVHVYGGPRGEPALGPTAYPHRASASENPAGTISHHLQDSTHIATNVVMAGATHGPVRLEVSGFHGREPDEQRWGLERGAIDSFAARLTVTPSANWTGQFSMGRIKGPETLHPLRPALRTTASIMHARGGWATSLIWGRNVDLEYTQQPVAPLFAASAPSRFQPRHIVSVPTRIPRQIYNSFLAESTYRWRRNWIWGRAESADRSSTFLFEEAPFVLLVDEQRIARVQAFTGGYERQLPWNTGIGAQLTVYRVPPLFSPIYDAHPRGIQIFMKWRLGAASR